MTAPIREMPVIEELRWRLFVILNFTKEPEKVIPRICEIVDGMVTDEIRRDRARARKARQKRLKPRKKARK